MALVGVEYWCRYRGNILLMFLLASSSYGDLHAATFPGRLVTMFCMVIGMSTIGLLTGFLITEINVHGQEEFSLYGAKVGAYCTSAL